MTNENQVWQWETEDLVWKKRGSKSTECTRGTAQQNKTGSKKLTYRMKINKKHNMTLILINQTTKHGSWHQETYTQVFLPNGMLNIWQQVMFFKILYMVLFLRFQMNKYTHTYEWDHSHQNSIFECNCGLHICHVIVPVAQVYDNTVYAWK